MREAVFSNLKHFAAILTQGSQHQGKSGKIREQFFFLKSQGKSGKFCSHSNTGFPASGKVRENPGTIFIFWKVIGRQGILLRVRENLFAFLYNMACKVREKLWKSQGSGISSGLAAGNPFNIKHVILCIHNTN